MIVILRISKVGSTTGLNKIKIYAFLVVEDKTKEFRSIRLRLVHLFKYMF